MHLAELRQYPSLWDLFNSYSMRLQRALCAMELRGAPVDLSPVPELLASMDNDLHGVELSMIRTVGKTINTNKQSEILDVLRRVLTPDQFDTLSESSDDDEDDSGPSTGKELLEALSDTHPIIPLILDHRTLNKLRGTYVEPISTRAYNGRIHASFSEYARTGRQPVVTLTYRMFPGLVRI
jgi:DNA polymerase-1